MGFRNEFFKEGRLPERIRQRATAAILAAIGDMHRDHPVRVAEFPRFARELALRS
ncbi:hypothetical protein [Arvimicrobium flavum]|uniref:hypothetical protein n=1 Tax=Arvimicrobium flavum TaxID=3393320 RepID=UPI00237A6E79|nr:hypothetical protein [Mesorhizobium shangrilense]